MTTSSAPLRPDDRDTISGDGKIVDDKPREAARNTCPCEVMIME